MVKNVAKRVTSDLWKLVVEASRGRGTLGNEDEDPRAKTGH